MMASCWENAVTNEFITFEFEQQRRNPEQK